MRPSKTLGLRHLALFVQNLDACVRFYIELLGMQLEWQPDPDNYYLTSGNDNLALHRAPLGFDASKHQKLDHLGFILATPEDVDDWYRFLVEQQVPMLSEPRTHRDGARSFYCLDPEQNRVQMIYHPPISAWGQGTNG